MRDPKTEWSESIASELNFWRRTIKDNPARFAARYTRETPSNEALPALVSLFSESPVRILDVGSGPAPVVLGRYQVPIEVTATDALAEHYVELLREFKIACPVDLVNVEGEQLVARFGAESFHISHVQNALDHSYSPIDALKQMVACTKPGGIIIVRTIINEGSNENFHGLHQYDLSPGAGTLHIRHRDGQHWSVREELGAELAMILVGTHSSQYGKEIQDWTDIVMVKAGATPEFLSKVETAFYEARTGIGHRVLARAIGADGQLGKLKKEHADLRSLHDESMQARRREAHDSSQREAALQSRCEDTAKKLRQLTDRHESLLNSLGYQLGATLMSIKPRETNDIRGWGQNLLQASRQLRDLLQESRRRRARKHTRTAS